MSRKMCEKKAGKKSGTGKPVYICRKCHALAEKKDRVCKPEKIR